MNKILSKNIFKTFLKIIYKLKLDPENLLRYLQLQLFITLFAWPILLYWGLPLSLASVFGNLIFGPFILLFLILSCAIFFTELLFIPNSLLIYLLEALTSCWSYVASFSDKSWLFKCQKPHIIIAIFIPIIACAIMQHKKLTSKYKSIIALFGFILLISIYLKIPANKKEIFTIPCFEKEITIISYYNNHSLLDPGIIGRRISSINWVNFTLTPFLIKKGISSLKNIISLKPSSLVFKAITSLAKQFNVENIYLVTWQGKLNYSGWAAWQELLETVINNKINLIIIDTETININLEDNYNITLKPGKILKKSTLKYPEVSFNLPDFNLKTNNKN